MSAEVSSIGGASALSAEQVVMKAYINACKALDIKSDLRAEIIGVNASTFSRNLQRGFDAQSKTHELQLHMIRLYRSLFAIAGGDENFMRHWFNTDNVALNGTPAQLCLSILGICNVNQYLDAMRGKI